MPLQMIDCPHCGTPNSAQKRVCFSCQREIRPPDSAKAPARRVPMPPPAPPLATTGKPAPRIKSPDLRRRAQFYRQMQTQLYAGIPLGQALVLLQQSGQLAWKPMLLDMAQHVQGGAMFSSTMARYPHIYPDWEISVIRAGEIGGALPEVFGNVAEALEDEYELRTQTHSKTFHLKLTAGVLAFVCCFIVCAKSVIARLLATGQHIGSVEDFIRLFRPAIINFIILASIFLVLKLIIQLIANSRRGSIALRTITFKVPLIGPILSGNMQLRFVNILGTLWGAGVPPVEALQTAARASDDYRLMERLSAQTDSFLKGMPLSTVLTNTRCFPPEAMYLITTGEASGNVPEMLRKIGEYMRDDLHTRMKTLPMKAQVVLYLIVAPIVAYVVGTTFQWYFDTMFKAAGGD